jgi:hypothetical protein
MVDRDRLIELILKSEILCDTCGENSNTYCAEALADYLLANGVIVPPCKVGDKIYMLVTRKTTSFEYPNGKMKRVENQHTFIKETYLTKLNFFKVIDSFSKTVFLTKEEAEQALAERSEA